MNENNPTSGNVGASTVELDTPIGFKGKLQGSNPVVITWVILVCFALLVFFEFGNLHAEIAVLDARLLECQEEMRNLVRYITENISNAA